MAGEEREELVRVRASFDSVAWAEEEKSSYERNGSSWTFLSSFSFFPFSRGKKIPDPVETERYRVLTALSTGNAAL